MKTTGLYVDPTASSVTPAVQAAADKAGAVPVVGLAATIIGQYYEFTEARVLVEHDDEAADQPNVTVTVDMPSDA